MKLKLAEPPRLYTIDLQTRMPFRYGIATLTALPHLFLEVQLDIDGKVHRGVAAENLAPKWFTKNPHTTPQQDIDEMLGVIRAACDFARAAGPAATVYELWWQIYEQQERWGTDRGLPPLLWNFGVTLVERAIIDAFCRATDRTFAAAVRANALGIVLGEEFVGTKPADHLPPAPSRSLIVRHTVGLADPLTDAEIPSHERLDDGLPQSLEACIRAYGLSHFKIKLAGDPGRDAARLRDIARVLEPHDRVAFTLDGNENYRDLPLLSQFWQAVEREPFARRLLFIEQPLHRDATLTTHLHDWPDRPPMIIDEADGEMGSFGRARKLGYAGTSFKSCKGVIKGILAACLARVRGTILSAEDLTTVGPVSLLQDLAVVATLGIPHVERNGHHYFRGLSMFPRDVQQQVLAHHGDLYRDVGFPTLDIRNGTIALGSVVDAPFGHALPLDLRQLTTDNGPLTPI